MKKILGISLLTLFVLSFIGCDKSPKTFKIDFDNTKEYSGKKFAIKDISTGLPTNWDGYNFVVLEYRITSAQRFYVGFNTDEGYNELRVMNYTPNGWNKMAIPLVFYRELPAANIDLAATFNQPRYTGWVNLGGKRGPLHGVDSIGIRMRVPIGSPSFEIRSIALAVEDPGDEYLEDTPSVDEFGQWNLGDYEDKIHSLEQLQAEWAAEENEQISTADYNYSKYGGYLQKQVKGTGFFRTEKIDGRWWFVDPEGYLFLSVGIDCVSPGGGGNAKQIDKRRNMFKELPSEEVMAKIRPNYGNRPNAGNRPQELSVSFGAWNLYRRYGDDFRTKANDMIIRRMNKWGLNTIANWSSGEVTGMNKIAYTAQMRGLRMERDLMGLADVYAPGFALAADSAMKEQASAQKDNPWIVGYFVGNEPAWLEQEARLCGMILEGSDRPIKTELQKFLAAGGDTPERRKDFIYKTFDIFLQTAKKAFKKYDPNHLNLGIRFGNIAELDEEILIICKNAFDILSFNCYSLYPDYGMMDRVLRVADMPMIIGEYHFGTVDRGMAQSLWQVNSQRERGVAYSYYTEKGYAHPGLIGTGYFQWNDQDLTGRRNDGENYNCGLVDVTDRPYRYQVEAMMETAKRLYSVHAGETAPFDKAPEKARGHEGIPNVWIDE